MGTVRLQAHAASDRAAWCSLGTPPSQLLLHNTLPTGQSFRWRLTEPPDTYTGVIGQRVVQLRQLPDDVHWRVLARGPGASPDADAAAMREYFNLDAADLAALYSEWCTRDERFMVVSPHLPGARMLRQDPLECLFEFICSSNNHISRIHGMVERLCSTYGSELLPPSSNSGGSSSCDSMQHQQQPGEHQPGTPATPQAMEQQEQHAGSQPPDISSSTGAVLLAADAQLRTAGLPFGAAAGAAAAQAAAAGDKGSRLTDMPQLSQSGAEALLQHQQQQNAAQLPFHAFPTLRQLSAATEEALRADGFGYRAKFIVGSVQQLLAKPGGGEAWLLSLRDKPYAEAHEALCSLPGVGPKVAACICLFSLDKHDAIPVDTHVWDLATRYYAPHLAKRTLNRQLHADIQQVFVQRFGPHAGWAHNTLFISELASHRQLLPVGLASPAAAAAAAGNGGGGSRSGGQGAKKSSNKKRQAKKHSVGALDAGRNEAQHGEGEVPAADLGAPAAKHSSRTRRRTTRYANSNDASEASCG